MACVFAFILSFGLGPGKGRERLLVFDSVSRRRRRRRRFVKLFFLLPCRWRDKHPHHRALHSDGSAGRVRDRGLGELAQLLLHRPGLPLHRGRCLSQRIPRLFTCS